MYMSYQSSKTQLHRKLKIKPKGLDTYTVSQKTGDYTSASRKACHRQKKEEKNRDLSCQLPYYTFCKYYLTKCFHSILKQSLLRKMNSEKTVIYYLMSRNSFADIEIKFRSLCLQKSMLLLAFCTFYGGFELFTERNLVQLFIWLIIMPKTLSKKMKRVQSIQSNQVVDYFLLISVHWLAA